MPFRCCVKKCQSNSTKIGHSVKHRLFRIPSNNNKNHESDSDLLHLRRKEWFKRLGIQEVCNGQQLIHVCSRHFLNGKPSYYRDTCNPDWAPTQNLPNFSKGQLIADRFDRRQKRIEKRKQLFEMKNALPQENTDVINQDGTQYSKVQEHDESNEDCSENSKDQGEPSDNLIKSYSIKQQSDSILMIEIEQLKKELP